MTKSVINGLFLVRSNAQLTHMLCLENVENYHMLQTAWYILHITHTQRSTLKWEFLLRQKIIIKQH